jgi:hypothetical protein
MYATLTKQGTAMAETALCAAHYSSIEHVIHGLQRAQQADDYDGGQYSDCTGNDALECFGCENVNDPEYV